MPNVFSSRYFPLIKADKLQREPPICVSTSLFTVLSTPLPLYNQGSELLLFPYHQKYKTPQQRDRRYTYSKIKHNVFYLLLALCFMSGPKSFPTYQRQIDSVSLSSRKPPSKHTR